MRKIILLFLLISILNLPAFSQDRPNILWIVSEDTSPLLGCYGDSYATTPHLDKFAKKAIRYENAFASAPACAPSRSTLITGMLASSLGTEQMRSRYPIPDFIKFFPSYLREAGYYTSNNSKKDYNTIDQPEAWNESSKKATYQNRKTGQPFFAVFNITLTHESKIHDRADKLKHDPEKAPIPPYHPATPEMKYDWAHFYDNIQAMDRQVGRILKELEDSGEAENTIVFYYSDHGGVVARSKRYVNESGLRVPLLIRFPEKYAHLAPLKPGSVTDRIVSFEDFAPTVLKLAGIPIPEYMQGTPFLGDQEKAQEKQYAFAFRGRIDETIEFVRSVRNKKYRYVRNYMPHKIYAQRSEYFFQAKSLVSWQKKYEDGALNSVQSVFWQQKPAEELYDIEADPYNIHNLAGNKKYSKILKKMRRANQEYILRTRDTGFIPESLRAAISGTSYDFAHSKEYPLEVILETAEMATSRKPEYLEEIIDRLDHKNQLVRYWAAMGCIILEDQALPAKEELIDLAKNDDLPAVRIAAAEALYTMGQTEPALSELTEILDHDLLAVRLEAIKVLEKMGADALSALPDIKKMIAARNKTDRKQPLWRYDHDVKVAMRIVQSFEKNARK